MNPRSKTLAERLDDYAIQIEFWGPEMYEGDQMLGCREILQTLLAEMTIDQLARLRTLDDQVLSLAAAHPMAPDWDIIMLHETVKLIGAGR
jgi:hypothetical protein